MTTHLFEQSHIASSMLIHARRLKIVSIVVVLAVMISIPMITTMIDLLYLAVIVLLVVAAVAYTHGCDRL